MLESRPNRYRAAIFLVVIVGFVRAAVVIDERGRLIHQRGDGSDDTVMMDQFGFWSICAFGRWSHARLRFRGFRARGRFAGLGAVERGFQRSRVNNGLEDRPRLSRSLNNSIEL